MITPPHSEHTVERSLTEHLKDLSVAILQESPHWAGTLDRFAAEAARLERVAHNWDEKYSFGRQIEDIYGGMGSFNDVTLSSRLKVQKTLLYETVEDYLRLCWRQLGRTWYEVTDSERFHVGDRVVLIHGEVISLDRCGEPSKAPKSNLVYTVVELYSNDVDNMPRYLVSSGNRSRVARHNALQRSSP
jgi:hypothetical protein